jgi:uncharacterized protein YcnI
LSTCTMLAVSAPAWAHLVVSPEEVAAGDYTTLTVSVPTEKEVPTTKIRMEVPEGFLLSGVQPVPGWEYAFEEDGGVITAVTWSGGEIGPREFQQFLVQARAPDRLATLRERSVRRLSKVATAAVVVLASTGLYAILLHVPSLQALVATPYGRALLVKLGLLTFVLAISAANFLLRGRRPFGHLVVVELLLALGLFIATGFLTSLPPASAA